MLFQRQPRLKGDLVELRPLTPDDWEQLYAIASDPAIWEQHPAQDRYLEQKFRLFFNEALASGGALIVIDAATGQVIGSSRYQMGNEPQNRLEIGWTFLARSHWGGAWNGEMKSLMLQHAFGSVDRVIFRIGPENFRSQRAVEKIGGVRAGTALDGRGETSFVYEMTAEMFNSSMK